MGNFNSLNLMNRIYTLATAAVLVLIATFATASSSSCLYCRRMDTNSGFLVSYSYCTQLDECLKDAWNYINRPCLDKWKSGKSYELEACEVENNTCPGYVSDPEKFGTYENTTWSLAAGTSCKVHIDATKGVARVIFDETSFLGVETDYRMADVMTFDSAEHDITIYNGAETGPITFLISFSGASTLASAAIALGMLLTSS